MDQFNSFERIQSIRDHLLRNTIMRNSIFDYVELVVNFDNEVDLIQGNELNRYLKAITDFQNSLMRELITCQEKDRLSDISFHFENQELNGFANVKFPIIKPIKIVKGNSFSFYISKKAMKYLNDTIMKFEYLNETPKLPESYHFSIMATSLSTSALSIFTLALELHVNNEYTLPTPLRKTIEYYLPPSLADFVKQASKDTTIECINIAKNFNSELLLSFFCANIASMIKGKSTEQIREMFGIVNDFTPEEEEQIKRERQYITFEDSDDSDDSYYE